MSDHDRGMQARREGGGDDDAGWSHDDLSCSDGPVGLGPQHELAWSRASDDRATRQARTGLDPVAIIDRNEQALLQMQQRRRGHGRGIEGSRSAFGGLGSLSAMCRLARRKPCTGFVGSAPFFCPR